MQPYLLKETQLYGAWREQKLNHYPKSANELIIELNNPINLMENELKGLLTSCSKTNIAIYRCINNDQSDKQLVTTIAQQLGLLQLDANVCSDEDRISVIQDVGKQKDQDTNNKSHYIPYTNKALNWHTDGYYNSNQQRINAFLMHCVRPAKSGGENNYLDPEIAYILMRDENPDYIAALMQDDVMTIPANEIDEKNIREEQTGPVFYIDNQTQTLGMRFTARKRNIVWKKDKIVQNALSFLHEILEGSPLVFHYNLKAGEGVICNNVLHNRSAFVDHEDKHKKRMLYRGRFYNRVTSDQNSLHQAVNH